MKIKVIAIGKLKSRAIAELVEDYSGRIGRYFQFELSVAKDESSVKLDRDDFLIVCDEHGDEATSKGLGDFISQHMRIGTKRLTFFVGDAKGVGAEMKSRAKTTLSLSKMTFPHELARVILLEQLYRACTILKGEKYHYG
jgi:23S rRNA (pseudouridine1915-N3)-methyltransferase